MKPMPALFLILLASAGASIPAQSPTFDRVMITEVSWAEPDGLEITNFTSATVDLTGWTVRWHDGTLVTSATLDVTLPMGASLVVTEPFAGGIPEAPPGTPVLQRLPVLGTANQAFNVAVRDAAGTVVDEVRITDTSALNSTVPSLGGTFRSFARRGQIAGSVCVERIWGLDSDGGKDWTEETVRSFGLESRSSGIRGGDSPSVRNVHITEISTQYVELRHASANTFSMQNWFLLFINGQDGSVVRATLFPSGQSVGPLDYLVIGDTTTPPAELPAGVPYLNIGGPFLPGIPFASQEFTCALYDNLGRLVDLVRTTGDDDTVVHNHPRLPSAWDDFTGGAVRADGAGDNVIGRLMTPSPLFPGINVFVDTDSGADWRPLFTRSMGSDNTAWVGNAGLGDGLDVRFHDTALGQGMTLILNAGPAHAGHAYSFFFSLGHLQGQGAFFGLGPDAILNWFLVLASPPFSGLLDARGSARVDIPSGSIGSNLDVDCIFILQDATGVLAARTPIIEFDT